MTPSKHVCNPQQWNQNKWQSESLWYRLVWKGNFTALISCDLQIMHDMTLLAMEIKQNNELMIHTCIHN